MENDCIKISYNSRKEAKSAIRRINNTDGSNKWKRKNSNWWDKRRLRGEYRCDKCGNWHISKQK